MQHLLDVGKNPVQQAGLLENLAAVLAGPPLHVVLAAGNQLENQRNGQLHLVQIGDIVDKRKGLTRMDEADRRRVAGGNDGRLRQAVKAGVGGRQGAVYRVGGVPVAGIEAAALPFDLEPLGLLAVRIPHAVPLPPADLLQGKPRLQQLAETFFVHPADHGGAATDVAIEFRLAEEFVGAEAPPAAVADDLLLLLAKHADRALSARGSELGGMFYASDDLMALRAAMAASNLHVDRFSLRYNPWDLGASRRPHRHPHAANQGPGFAPSRATRLTPKNPPTRRLAALRFAKRRDTHEGCRSRHGDIITRAVACGESPLGYTPSGVNLYAGGP